MAGQPGSKIFDPDPSQVGATSFYKWEFGGKGLGGWGWLYFFRIPLFLGCAVPMFGISRVCCFPRQRGQEGFWWSVSASLQYYLLCYCWVGIGCACDKLRGWRRGPPFAVPGMWCWMCCSWDVMVLSKKRVRERRYHDILTNNRAGHVSPYPAGHLTQPSLPLQLWTWLGKLAWLANLIRQTRIGRKIPDPRERQRER